MHESTPLTVGEFTRWAERFDRTLGAVDGKVDSHSERIAAIETTLIERGSADRRTARNTATGWSAAVAGGFMLLMEALKAWTGGK